MPDNTGDPKLRNSVKRRRGDNAGEHFAFFRGAFVIGQQTSDETSTTCAHEHLHLRAEQHHPLVTSPVTSACRH